MRQIKFRFYIVACFLSLLSCYSATTQASTCNDSIEFANFAKKHTYKIFLTEDDEKSVGTGFTVKGQQGIFTAAHNVLGVDSGKHNQLRKIEAQRADGYIYEDLIVSEVDLAADIVRLVSIGTEVNDPEEGFSIGNWKGAKCVNGYGLAREKISLDTIEVNIGGGSGLATIKKLFGTSSEELATLHKMSFIKTPDISSLQVIDINQYFLPGISGAPIIDSTGNVVAMADGGILYKGNVPTPKSWAVPLKIACMFNDKRKSACIGYEVARNEIENRHEVYKLKSRINEDLGAEPKGNSLQKIDSVGTVLKKHLIHKHIDLGRKIDFPAEINSDFTGMHRSVKTSVLLKKCNVVSYQTTAVNNDSYKGYCFKPVFRFENKNPSEAFPHLGEGRICVPSKLEVEAKIASREVLFGKKNPTSKDKVINKSLREIFKVKDSDIASMLKASSDDTVVKTVWKDIQLPNLFCESDPPSFESDKRLVKISVGIQPEQKSDGVLDAMERLKTTLIQAGDYIEKNRALIDVVKSIGVFQ